VDVRDATTAVGRDGNGVMVNTPRVVGDTP